MSSLTSSRIEAWRHQIESPEPPRGLTRKRAFEEMDNCPDLPHREHGPFDGQEPSKSCSSSRQKRRCQDHPTSLETSVSQNASTDVSFATPSLTIRSGSPARRIRIATLRYTVPKFITGSGKSGLGDITTPDHIRALLRYFGEEACTSQCIPASIFKEVREISQDMDKVPTRSRGKKDGQDHSALLKIVKNVYHEANYLFSHNGDENNWYPVVRQILAYGLTKKSPFYIVDAQSRAVCQDLLPRNARNEHRPIGTVKVDFSLHFNTGGNREVHEALNPWLQKNHGNLSAFNDFTDTRDAFSLSLVKVKQVGGDYTDALYRVMVASAAIQQRLIRLQAGRSEDSLQHRYHQTLPVVCLAVIGHFWYLQIVFRSSRDCVVRKIHKALFSDTNIQV
ncbi:hypothetical protein MMC07_007401 [Pseudocyphellaria aurata]|nr:hypothetical protein [Pseudocyphellaria aurata]